MLPRLCAFAACAASLAAAARPNMVILLTDDQDVLLGGVDDMPSVQEHLIRGGRSFTSGYTVNPICCPSRTALISGRYPHNLEEEETSVGWCGDLAADGGDNRTWIAALHDAGYATALHGKYHNEPPTAYTPRGYDDFFVLLDECNYENNSWVVNEAPGGRPRQVKVPGYMTSVIGNRSLAWLRGAVANASAGDAPFMIYIAPHAPHMPTTPAPWYMDTPLPSERAPRTPAYNASGAGKHWVIAELDPLGEAMAEHIDAIYTQRHRALLSVDDILAGVMQELAPVLDNTYIFYTSDHGLGGERSGERERWRSRFCVARGVSESARASRASLTRTSSPAPHPATRYNLGTFRLSVEKFHMLQNDIQVPFFVRGPGIAAGSTSPAIVSQVDIGETLLALAGVAPLPSDGRSFAAELSAPDGVAVGTRDRLLIEYVSRAHN